jgi:hypothetical protein
MSYFLDLFSPLTHEGFTKSDRTTTGFRQRHASVAQRVRRGDKLVCYVTKVSRWCGLLEVLEGPFVDNTPIFVAREDPFVIRFRVLPHVWLPLENAIPIHQAEVWEKLSFTCGMDRGSPGWTGKLRGSLNRLEDADGVFLEQLLRNQAADPRVYPLDEQARRNLTYHRIRTSTRDVPVTVPEDVGPEEVVGDESLEVRESLKIQALLGQIGTKMGMQIWIPSRDRAAVAALAGNEPIQLLERLPLNYDETTLKTIQEIDVLWLRARAIKRAFEVEHSTSIYSGILRMADLLALQPNMDIRLHIVAPEQRRKRVFEQIQRPIFSILERGPLAENCSFLSYGSVHELAANPHLSYLSDKVIEEYEEYAGEEDE